MTLLLPKSNGGSANMKTELASPLQTCTAGLEPPARFSSHKLRIKGDGFYKSLAVNKSSTEVFEGLNSF